jgi:ketosteroid isomerase-like protein
MNEEAEIRGAEDARIASLLAGDCDKLAGLLADDLVHIHANGLVDSKASYLASVREKLDSAVVTGKLNQTMRIRDSGAVLELQAVVTQVWLKVSGGWQQSTYHASRLS